MIGPQHRSASGFGWWGIGASAHRRLAGGRAKNGRCPSTLFLGARLRRREDATSSIAGRAIVARGDWCWPGQDGSHPVPGPTEPEVSSACKKRCVVNGSCAGPSAASGQAQASHRAAGMSPTDDSMVISIVSVMRTPFRPRWRAALRRQAGRAARYCSKVTLSATRRAAASAAGERIVQHSTAAPCAFSAATRGLPRSAASCEMKQAPTRS